MLRASGSVICWCNASQVGFTASRLLPSSYPFGQRAASIFNILAPFQSPGAEACRREFALTVLDQCLKFVQLALLRLVASADGKSLPAETAYRGAEIAYTLLMDLNIFGNDKFLRAAKLIAFTLLDVKARRAQDRLYGTPQGQDFAEIRTRIGWSNIDAEVYLRIADLCRSQV